MRLSVLGDAYSKDERFEDRPVAAAMGQEIALAEPRHYAYGNPWAPDNEKGGLALAQYWRILMKHRWVVLASVVGALALGLSVTLLMTPVFSAQTTVKIDRETARIVNVEGVEPQEQLGANEEFFQTQYGILRSRTLAMNVINRLGYTNGNAFFKAMGATPPSNAPLTERRRMALELFQKNLGVSPVRGSRLVTVSFQSPDPQLAATVANATAEEFIASNLNRRYESSDYARQFLETKLADAKAKLEASERLVADYATSQKIINVGPKIGDDGAEVASQSLTVTSLVALNSALSTARGERIKAEERWRRAQNSKGVALPEVLDNPTVQELTQTKAKLSAEYQDLSQELKPAHPKMVQLKARLDETQREIDDVIQNVKSSLQTQYEVALNQERSFEAQVRRLEGNTLDLGQRSIQYGILQREADTNRTLYEGLLQRYKEIGVAGGISANNISIVDRAEVPVEPSEPKPLVNMLLALFAGLGLGVALAFLLELLDESIATPEDINVKLGLPLIGSVPRLNKGETPVSALGDSRSAFSEAYYSIRTALQFSTAEGAPKTLLVTSSRPAEGKSTTALAIAKNFARIGGSVLLIDGDLRNPSMHRNLGVDNTKGLSNVLTGSMSIDEAAIPTDTRGLSFLACGPLPPNPAELLAGRSWRIVLEEALQRFSMVVVDGPPVLGLADAPTFAASIAGTVFVVESRGTRRGLARTAIQRLQLGHARIIGGVLTKFDVKRASYGYGANYAYAYEYEYGSKSRLADKS